MGNEHVTTSSSSTTNATPDGGWTFVGEFPYCNTCGAYSPPHNHNIDNDAYRRQRIEDWFSEHLNGDRAWADPKNWTGWNGPSAEPAVGSSAWKHRALTVLGCAEDATPDEVRSAYRKRLKECHPDLGGTAEETRAVIAAYDELKAQGRAT